MKTSILLGECYVAMGRREHALKRYQHVIQRFPDSPHAKQAQEAMEKLKGAETDDPVSGAES